MKKLVLVFISIFMLIVSGCNKSVSKQGEFSIVATTFPCFDAARAILGESLANDSVKLTMLVKPGIEVHSFDPSPIDIININDCDLFIYVGGESDEWVERIIKSSKTKSDSKYLKLIDYVDTVEEIEFEENETEELHEHEHETHENPHEMDEHIWTSPKNEIKIIEVVYSSLCKLAEKQKMQELLPIFNKNRALYIDGINRVEKITKEILESKNEKFILMADRFPFAYYVDYYGLEFDAAFSGCSTAVEASTQTISRLIDTIKSKNLPAVFYIELGNHKIADTIAKSNNVDAILLQSGQNVTREDFETGITWISLMKKNADALNKGLR